MSRSWTLPARFLWRPGCARLSSWQAPLGAHTSICRWGCRGDKGRWKGLCELWRDSHVLVWMCRSMRGMCWMSRENECECQMSRGDISWQAHLAHGTAVLNIVRRATSQRVRQHVVFPIIREATFCSVKNVMQCILHVVVKGPERGLKGGMPPSRDIQVIQIQGIASRPALATPLIQASKDS